MSELARRLLAQNAKDHIAQQDAIGNQQLWFNPSKLGEALWNTVSYPFRNPDQTAEFGLSMAPGSGEAMSLRDAWDASGRAGNALTSGNFGEAASEYGNLATALAGALPGAGIIARGTKRGAAWMDRNLPGGVNRLLDAMTPSDPGNTMNIFAGPTAKTADHVALAKAQEMAQSGASRDDIWRDTGWMQGVDGKWRFEIDDSPMGVTLPRNSMSGQYNAYKAAIDHPALFEAYPPMQRNRITFDHRIDDSSINVDKPSPNAFDSKQYDTEIGVKGRIRVDGSRAQTKPNAIRSSTGHELQHNVQAREGFAPGNDPESIFHEIMEANPNMDPREATDLAIDIYSRSAGEAEARNVATRLNMSAAERRAKAPWLTQDVPDDQQIVRFR